jgi:hypothetical protein
MINIAADSREKEISLQTPKSPGKVKLCGYFIKMDIWKKKLIKICPENVRANSLEIILTEFLKNVKYHDD